MPWKNNRALLKDVDKLPHGPSWVVKTFTLEGNRGSEDVEFWRRDPLDVIKQLLLDRTLGRHMHWAPQRHFTSRSRKQQRRDEIWTADWMWDVLVSVNTHNRLTENSPGIDKDCGRVRYSHIVYRCVGRNPVNEFCG